MLKCSGESERSLGVQLSWLQCLLLFLCCRGKALVSLLYLEASISPSILCKRNFCYENHLSLKCDYSGRVGSSFSLIVGFHEAAQMRPGSPDTETKEDHNPKMCKMKGMKVSS